MQLARTTPEQRVEMYEDVRALIVPGFLAHSFSIGEARFTIRSLDRTDWIVLQHRTYGLTEKRWRAWCIASATWMVNGSLLHDDEEATYRLYEMYSGLPTHVVDTCYSILNGLMRRVQSAADRVEAFLYESESRNLWRTDGPSILIRQSAFSPRRFDNPVISLWIYYNQVEDLREAEERDWTMAKFAVGPHAPKSIKKLNAQDKQRHNDLTRRRGATQDRVWYEFKGLIDKQELTPEERRVRFGDHVIMAETEEELRESMRRWVDGIKDDHDNVVDNVKAKIKYEVEKRKEENLKRRAALDAALEEEGLDRTKFTPLVGEAGKKFLARMQSRLPGASVVIDDHTHNSAYTKYIEKNPEVGTLHTDEYGNIKSLEPVTADMLEVLTKPAQGDGPSLQEQIEGRRPTFDHEGED